MVQFIYVEMICNLEGKVSDEGISSEILEKPISEISVEDLYKCYTAAFDAGDAKFYELQDQEEKRRYFDQELGFPEILGNPASFIYLVDDKLIGFSFVMPYLEDNYHISCMCLLPEYQGQGLGLAMLNRIKKVAHKNGCKTLTLGTEPEMKAYRLYKDHGFVITAEHQVDLG